MCKIIVNKHGGAINVCLEPAKELVIRMSLPIQDDALEECAPSLTNKVSILPGKSRNRDYFSRVFWNIQRI